ncbi:serine/threonine-protein kinase [Roseimaritima ulvae]|uniref:Serine/threonine-protein kinase PrkC n=1 Tax=Roseimaritima ulvae TaxID=980254 RepID=A0A5B9QRA4_9BACT|nr:serine/threonine-protein kinase [Roseimaritima ulvae]QEG40439.1 Serine/threonine-protein kinase PrkC [Roseimaritima ulvae]
MKHPLERSAFQVRAGQKLTFGKVVYKLSGKLGDGAVGIVRRASGSSGKDVAIKFLAPDPKYIDPASFDDVASRFVLEGQRGSKLDHPRLVEIYGYSANLGGEDFASRTPANPYLVMELVRGKTLERYIRGTNPENVGKLNFSRDRLLIAIQLADALQYIHKKRMVHRDIKPANIFVSGSTNENNLPIIKLGDFGIVKWGDFQQHLSTGMLTVTHQQGLGTMKYMSPEQSLDPKNITIKSDIYSFGITLYELLTGEILSSPHHVFQIMHARLTRGSTHARYATLGH